MCSSDNQDMSSSSGAVDARTVKLLYRGKGSAQIRGGVTGRIYQFPRHSPTQEVDVRDVPSLVRTRLFTHVKF